MFRVFEEVRHDEERLLLKQKILTKLISSFFYILFSLFLFHRDDL